MKRMYAPWRNDYVTRKARNSESPEMKNGCVFCHQLSQNDDDKYFIIKRFTHCAVVMNYYPYNAGHLLILTYKHAAFLKELSSVERTEIIEVANASIIVLEQVMNARGFNIGINSGAAAQGSIPDHLHMHVLPRWQGDTSFLETLTETTIISSDLFKTFKQLKEQFEQLDF